MASIISIANQKGGVGKTTTAVNLADYASLSGLHVALIDNDPQGNASSVFGQGSSDGCFFLHGTLLHEVRPGLSLGPSSPELLDIDNLAPRNVSRRLQRHIEQLKTTCDLIIIDCPPSLTTIPQESFAVSDLVLIPIQCEYYAMEGLSQLISVLQAMDDAQRPAHTRLLLTMENAEITLNREVAAEIRRYFPGDCLQTAIPRDAHLATAPSHNATIREFEPLCEGALAYLHVTKELLHAIRQ
jgi:chromosome partitioning protein